jgi:uncharacterized RDD family membrane protein YckC
VSEQSYEASTGGPSGPRASFWRRFGALLIDGIALGVVTGILAAFMSRNAANGISTLIGLIYFSYFEGTSGQTLGKKALGIRVIDFKAGGPIGFGRALIRYIGRIVSTIPLLLGYFWMLWDKEKQTWHDKFAGSVVVPESAYPVEKWP